MLKDDKGNRYIEWNFFKYYAKEFGPAVSELSWLWFLLALFINSLVNYPILAWTQRRARGIAVDRDDLWYVAGVVVAMGIWIVPSVVLTDLVKYND